jgi:hypothetical protein
MKKTKGPIHVPGFLYKGQEVPIPNMKDKAIAKAVKAFQKKRQQALLRELRKVVKGLRKDSKRKNAEIEAFKNRLHKKGA